jgi:HEAT repeat protein
MVHYPGTLEAIQNFLNKRPWGVSGAASALLLTEGDEEALSYIRALLENSSDKIRLQAALILGMWGSDHEALLTLQNLYPTVGRQQKAQILEALGKIGDAAALQFLVERLEEPYQILRMLASAAILQTLYH